MGPPALQVRVPIADNEPVEGAGRPTTTSGVTEGIWVVVLAIGFLAVLAVWSVFANLVLAGTQLARHVRRAPSGEVAPSTGVAEPAVVRAKAA